MINGFVYLDKIKSKQEFDELVILAKKDQHGVFFPTFTVKRHGSPETIGWLGLASEEVPIIFGWLSTENMKARDSFTVINQMENLVALKGSRAVVFPIPKYSPFYEVMPSLGYEKAGEYTFFVKQLT